MGNLPTNKTTRPVLERMAEVEAAVENFTQVFDSTFLQTRDHIALIMQTLEGIIGVAKKTTPTFDVEVDEFMKTKRQERLQKKADSEKAQLDVMLKNGDVKVSEVVGENSLLVGRLFDPSGNLNGAGREQALFASFSPDAQTALLGKGVGFTFESSNKHKFELLEIYDAVPKTPQPAPAVTATTTETKTETSVQA
jgi:hypothetical protein